MDADCRPAANGAGCYHYFLFHQMKFIKDNITPLLLIAIAAILLLMLIRKPVDKSAIKESAALIQAKDELIEAKQQFIEYLKEDNAWMDNHIKELRRYDSLLITKLNANQPKYSANEKKYAEIPAVVNNLDKHQLRREYANY